MDTIKYYKNPTVLKHQNNKLNEFRKIGKFTDLTLKSTDGKTMTVHKNILIAACPYFKTMFNSESNQNEIQLVDDVTITDLEILIEYFYTGEAKVTARNSENLYIKAQYFQLEELKQFCSDLLIQNLTRENCLIYWRISVKYSNYNLKVECLKFIKKYCYCFLKINAMDLTSKEFKIIMSEENLVIDQEDLYKFIVTWIKDDFESRNVDLMDLVKNLDYRRFSAEFIENEIMSDEILLKNQEFSSKMISITFKKLRAAENQLYSKKLYLVTNSGLYLLNWSEWKWTKLINNEQEKTKWFATAALNNYIFISGGWKKQNSVVCKDYEFWNIPSSEIRQLPQMLESRHFHKSVTFKEKIYCCGGRGNNGSIEIFDFETAKSNKGPTMNESKSEFGLVASDDSIYSFGGTKDINERSNIVEHYDPREGNWSIVSSDTPQSISGTMLSNNFIYCFENIFGGNIFDVRNHNWTDSLSCVPVSQSDIEYYTSCFDVVEFNEEIFGVFQTDNSNTWGTYKYDHIKHKWADLRIPIHLDEYDDIRLCVASQS